MQGSLPKRLEGLVLLRAFGSPVIAHRNESGLAVAREQGDDFMRRAAFVERGNQRLNDPDRAVKRSSIAPGFQVVSGRGVPVAKLSGLVVVKAGMDAQLGLQERGAKIEVGRRVVDGVAAENHEKVHLARV